MIKFTPTLLFLALSSLFVIAGCAGREGTSNLNANTSANTSANTAGANANINNNLASNANANARNANAVARNANAAASNANATASNANAVARNANARSIARAVEASPNNGETPIPEPTVGSFPNVEPSPLPSLETITRDGEPAELDELDREVAKLHEGKILFNPPSEMKQGKRERIEARVSFEDIGAALSQDLKGRAAPQIEPVKVSSIMKVILTGDQDAFAIEQFGTDEQIIKGRPFAQWSWDVTPLQSGKRSLHLQVTAVVSVAGNDKTIGIPVIDKRIQVHISPWFASKRFVSNNWQWLWTVIVIPGAGLLWGLRKKRRHKQSRSTHHEI